MIPERAWWVLAGATALLAAFLFFGLLGNMPLSDRDEGEYAATVAHMEKSGDWAVPKLNGRNYLEKPILVFWAMGASQRLFGPSELGIRLPSAASGFLVCLFMGFAVWLVSKSLSLATLTAAAAAFCPLSLLVGRAALTDMLLTLCTTVSLACFFLATERPPARARWWYLAAWAGLGLGFLAKGPVAPAVVLPAAGIYALAQRRLWHTIKTCQAPWGLLVFLAINLPWYGTVFMRLGDEFWRAFFVSQNIRRFSEVLLGHGGGFLYYLPVFLLGFFPFSAPALPALGTALFKNPRAVRAADPLARLRLFSAITTLVVLVVFSVAATKQPNYIMPAMPFFAFLAAYFLWRLLAGESAGRASRLTFSISLVVLGGLLTLLLAAVPAALPMFWDKILASVRPDSTEYALPGEAPALMLWPWLCALAAAATTLAAFWWNRLGRVGMQAAALTVGGALLSGLLIIGMLGDAASVVQAPAKTAALAVKQRLAPGARVVTFGLWKPTLLYYLDRDVEKITLNKQARLQELLGQPASLFVISRVRLAPLLSQVRGFSEIAREGAYLVGGNQAAKEAWGKGGGG